MRRDSNHTPEGIARITRGTRRGLDRRRERARLRARDLDALRKGIIPVCDAVLPHVVAAEHELAELPVACGGDVISPQRRALLEDAARVGVALRSELQRYAETREPECASRLPGLVAARRTNLVAAGLDRLERDVPDLATYLRERERALEAAKAHEPEACGRPGRRSRLQRPAARCPLRPARGERVRELELHPEVRWQLHRSYTPRQGRVAAGVLDRPQTRGLRVERRTRSSRSSA